MIGMGSVVTRHISTASKAFGNPCRVVGPNIIGIRKIGIESIDWWDEKNFSQADDDWGTSLQADHARYLAEIEVRAKEKFNIAKLRDVSRTLGN
jgi:acyl-[acyl carrier protein]--UDP-N-acetylglucosamine O-acyltransferase